MTIRSVRLLLLQLLLLLSTPLQQCQLHQVQTPQGQVHHLALERLMLLLHH